MFNSNAQLRYEGGHSKWSGPVAGVIVTLFLFWFLGTGVSQMVVAVLFVSIGAALVAVRPTMAVMSTIIYLLLMGDIRRYVSAHTSPVPQDPLLLVGPAVIGMLFARLAFERKLTPDTPLAKLVVALMIMMTLEIVNPLQGGLTIGVAGALYYIVPLLWFWAGRSLPSERLSGAMLKGVIPVLAAAAAVLGLYQTLVGRLAFEEQWVREQIASGGFNSIIVNGSVVRSFSFLTSPAEYAGFLAMGLVCCTAPLLVGRFRAVSVLIPLFAWAMVLASIRSAIVLSMVAIMALWALGGRDAQKVLGRIFLAVVIGGGGLYFGLHRLERISGGGDGGVSTLIDHTIQPLTNPGESSAEGHWALVRYGVVAGLKNPIGTGLGSTTIAAQKFSTHGGAGYENDIANMFASLGVFGGLLYIGIILYVLWHLCTVWRERRSFGALLVLGVLLSQLGYWLEGGHYALAAICWFLIGSMDRVRPLAESLESAHPMPAWQAEPRFAESAVAGANGADAAAAPLREPPAPAPRRAPITGVARPSNPWRPPVAPGPVGDRP
jgi:hypothetical protein